MTSKEKQEDVSSNFTSASCHKQYDMNNSAMQNSPNVVAAAEVTEKLDIISPDLEDNEIGTAPIEMLSEFLSAVMSRNYEAALNYCKIILEYEPTNKIVQEFYPLIEERLKQAKEGLLDSKSDDDSSIEEEEISSGHTGSDSEVEFEDSNANSTFEDSNANSTSDDYSTADNGGWTSTINTDSDSTEKEDPEVLHDDNSNPKTNLETTSEFGLTDSCGNKLKALVL